MEKYAALVMQLQQAQTTERMAAVRAIKNAIIGNKTKKRLFVGLGAIPKMVELLADPAADVSLKAQIAIVLGSFAYGDSVSIEALVHSGALLPLLDALSHPDTKYLEASARALKSILHNPTVPRDEIFQDRHVSGLVSLLKNAPRHDIQLAHLAASIIARCCETTQQQQQFARVGALPHLVTLLCSGHPKAQESSLDAIGAIGRGNQELVKVFMSIPVPASTIAQLKGADKTDTTILPLIIRFLHDKRPQMRLIAATCLTNFHHCQGIQRIEDMTLHVLPTLVKLFQDTSSQTIREKAPLVFAYLVSESEMLQKAASEVDAIAKLAQSLISLGATSNAMAVESPLSDSASTSPQHTTVMTHQDRLRESILLALGAACSLREECRKQVIDAKVLPVIVQCLESPLVGIRAAACQCTRSLSRSVKNLRTSLVDAGIATPLFKLLSDSSVEVQTTASATLCNIVLDFSPMKKILLESGGVEKLVKLVSAMDHGLRLNAVWALKNLLFQADSEVKKSVMMHLSYAQLESLVHDPEFGVQEQAVNLLRNLACGKESDIDDVFKGFGEDCLVAMIEKKLTLGSDDILAQALYVIVNVSTGNEKHKTAIIKNEAILKGILNNTSHPSSSVRVATVWCVINLTWPEDAGSSERVRLLKRLGFEERLRNMLDDSDMDVKDRVKTALQHFQSVSSAPPTASMFGGEDNSTAMSTS